MAVPMRLATSVRMVCCVRREIIQLAAFDVHHADHAPAHDQRHGQFRAHLIHRGQIARIFEHIAHANGLARAGGRADDSVAHGNAPVLDHFRRWPMAKRK